MNSLLEIKAKEIKSSRLIIIDNLIEGFDNYDSRIIKPSKNEYGEESYIKFFCKTIYKGNIFYIILYKRFYNMGKL